MIRPRIHRFLLFILLLSTLFSAFSSVSLAAAATITVSTCDQRALENAITVAAPGATIVFACNGTISTVSDVAGAYGYRYSINKDLTIDGTGRNVTLDAGQQASIFFVGSGGALTVKGLTFTHGLGSGDTLGGALTNQQGTLTVIDSIFSSNSSNGTTGGGAILNYSGTLNVSDSTFTDNVVSAEGGAIESSFGPLNVSNSTFSNNTATISGGAIHIQNNTATISGSTFNGNAVISGSGGGVANNGTTSIINSTFSGNTARGGGAIGNSFVLNLTQSTVSGNTATRWGNGILNGTFTDEQFQSTGTTTLSNTILANADVPFRGTNNGLNLGSNCSGADNFVNAGGNVADDSACFISLITNAQLKLGPLADNGGPTQTIALMPGSVAIDGVTCLASATTDQRGYLRPAIGLQTCDSGAYEVGAVAPTQTERPTTLDAVSGSGPYLGTATLTATLAASGNGLAAKSIAFTLNGSIVGSAMTDSDGIATLAGVSLTGINGGAYPEAVVASFVGDTTYSSSSGTGALTVSKIDQTIGFNLSTLPPKTLGDNSFDIASFAGSSSGLAVRFSSATISTCTVSGSTITIVGGGRCTIDANQGGNENFNPAPQVSQSFTITNPNTSPPVTTASAETANHAAYTFGDWTNQDVTVTLAATDTNSTVDGTYYTIDGDIQRTYTGPFTLNFESTFIIDFWSTNADGNTETRQTVTVKIDQSPPTITGTPATSPGENGWYTSPVTIHWTCSDALSGIATCPSDQTIATNGIRQTVNGIATDVAGNSTTAISSPEVKVILGVTTGPSISGTPTTNPNGNNWYNTPVTIRWTCSDTVSTVEICPGDQTITTEGVNQTVSGTATNVAGASTTVDSSAVNIDLTAPTITGTATTSPNANGWYNQAVTIHWTCDDALSGVATCPVDSTISTEGINQTVSGTVIDAAGNQTTVTSNPGVNIDLTAPTSVSGSAERSADHDGWYTSPVTITFSGDDAASGIASCTSTTYNGPDGATASVPGTCTDNAGNTSAPVSFAFKYDATAPMSVTGTADRTPDSNGWYNHSVGITFNGQDSVSGIASCTSTSYSGPDSTTASVSGSCIDNAGNTSALMPFDLKYDTTAPTDIAATFARDPDANDWYNHAVGITFSGEDATSGIASCTSTTYSGPDTASTSVSGSCTDVAGNQSDSASTTFKYDATAPTNVVATPDRAPNGAGWYNAPVTFTYTGEDATSGIGSCAPVTYDGPDNATASVNGGCTDVAGNTTTVTTTVAYDATAPEIAFIGNAGTYTILQTITISCSATDNLSGVASATCTGINAPAFTFNAGSNTVSVSVSDIAGNVGTGSVTFTITVATDDLTTLTTQFTSDPRVARQLQTMLTGVEFADRMNSANMKASYLNIYILLVNQQRGRALTNQEADTLIRLARTL